VATSEAYSIIKALIEKDLIVIQHQELVEWLDRLQIKGDITEEEITDLLQRADQPHIYDVHRCEFVSIEKLPSPIAPGAWRIFAGSLGNFIHSYLGYWTINSTILSIGLSLSGMD
jgi:hypothetical protein